MFKTNLLRKILNNCLLTLCFSNFRKSDFISKCTKLSHFLQFTSAVSCLTTVQIPSNDLNKKIFI